MPVAQNTAIGWILLGGSPATIGNNNLCTHSCIDIDSRLRSFWESEEVQTRPILKEDRVSDDHFHNNYSMDQNGRFIVRLPFNSPSPIHFGPTRASAVSRFLQIERKLQRDQHLAKEYISFMDEYETFGHMKRAPENVNAYYIPHHPVFKQSSSTTKLRVVFDASMKTSSGVSLNECLRVGPTIQDYLTSILTRFRKYPIAFTADLEKMYRQIRIHSQDQDFQRIVWRKSPDLEIQDYQLQTVTYGTACAQYLAVRSVQQLALDGAQSQPLASKSMLEDFYVDDLHTT